MVAPSVNPAVLGVVVAGTEVVGAKVVGAEVEELVVVQLAVEKHELPKALKQPVMLLTHHAQSGLSPFALQPLRSCPFSMPLAQFGMIIWLECAFCLLHVAAEGVVTAEVVGARVVGAEVVEFVVVQLAVEKHALPKALKQPVMSFTHHAQSALSPFALQPVRGCPFSVPLAQFGMIIWLECAFVWLHGVAASVLCNKDE